MRLAGVLGEHRLGVEGLQVADAAVHEQPDDRLRLGSEMRLAIRGITIAMEHRREGQTAEPETGVGEKPATIHETSPLVLFDPQMREVRFIRR